MWKIFKVQMKLAQPLAVGPGWRLGFVALTRLDVPPRTLWGAFTDALTRWEMAEGSKNWPEVKFPESKNLFVDFGRWVSGNIRFLPGILLVKKNNEAEERLLPWYRFGSGDCFKVCDQLGNGEESSASAKKRFVFGSGSTALDYNCMAAEESMLHETERIMPKVKINGDTACVWLEYVVFVKEHAKFLKKWLSDDALDYLRIGRDVAAGDGCFDRISTQELTEINGGNIDRLLNLKQSVSWNLDDPAGPILSATPSISEDCDICQIRLPGPFLMNGNSEAINGYWGELRPHIVREFDIKTGKGFGRKIGYAYDTDTPDINNPKWILEHGGVLAVDKLDGIYNFVLKRDGWENMPEKMP
jgi:hypothetical protein